MQLGKTDRTAEMTTFLAVACGGSLSAAARELALTPSAVSRQPSAGLSPDWSSGWACGCWCAVPANCA